MTPRLSPFLVGALFTLIAIYVATTMAMGVGVYQMFQLMMALAPVLVILIILTRKAWLGIFLISWAVSMRIPIILFDAITVGFIVISMIGVFYVVERLILRKPLLSVDHWAVGLLLAAGIVIAARLLLDRPGSARLGGAGGLRHAVTYAAAVPLFFVTDQLAREPYDPRKMFRTVMVIAVFMFVWRAVFRIAMPSGIPIYFGWYEGALWFFFPLTLAWLIKRALDSRAPMAVPLIFSVIFLGISILSPFRSRIYFAVGSIGAVFWCMGYRLRLLMGMTALFFAMILILTFVPADRIPVVVRRSLSTVMPFDRDDMAAIQDRGISVSSEFGWGSDFRKDLADMAFRSIREKPWAGQGWSFSAAEVAWAAMFSEVAWAASSLVTAGDYHNSLLTVAVKCGLPAAIALTLALAVLLARSMLCSNRIPSGWTKTLYAGLAGALTAIVGQTLMNGGGQDLQSICILLGFFHGTRRRWEQERQGLAAEECMDRSDRRSNASQSVCGSTPA